MCEPVKKFEIDDSWISAKEYVPRHYNQVVVRCVDTKSGNRNVMHGLGYVTDLNSNDWVRHIPVNSMDLNPRQHIEWSLVYQHHPDYKEAREKHIPNWYWHVSLNPDCGPDANKYKVTHWKDVGLDINMNSERGHICPTCGNYVPKIKPIKIKRKEDEKSQEEKSI